MQLKGGLEKGGKGRKRQQKAAESAFRSIISSKKAAESAIRGIISSKKAADSAIKGIISSKRQLNQENMQKLQQNKAKCR